MTLQSKKGIAVVGCGSIGMRHLRILSEMPDVHVIAVPKRKERAVELSREGFSVCENLREAASIGVSLCLVASDTKAHVEDGLEALNHGMDLFVEKPMAEDSLAAVKLEERSLQVGKFISVGCVLRFSESLNYFRSLLPEVGDIHAVEVVCRTHLPSWRPDRNYKESYSARSDEGGVLRDLIHEIDYATWLFGWPKSVDARLVNLGLLGIESEEMASLRWETPSKSMVTISLDYISKVPRRTISAYGKDGTLEWDGIAERTVLKRPGIPDLVKVTTQARDALYQEQIRALLFDQRKGMATGLDGVRALAICDAARLSSLRRSEIQIEYPL